MPFRIKKAAKTKASVFERSDDRAPIEQALHLVVCERLSGHRPGTGRENRNVPVRIEATCLHKRFQQRHPAQAGGADRLTLEVSYIFDRAILRDDQYPVDNS